MRTKQNNLKGIVCCTVIALLTASALAQEEPSNPPIEAGMEVSQPVVNTDPDTSEGLRMNFQGVPLDTVLEYLSKEAGFTIVREAQVDGRINMESHQPLNKDEVVELLNTVLNSMGYAALRSGRTLTIVKREDAIRRNIPVKMGSEPEGIPANDEMVTQIIPVRYADAAKLVENLQALLAPYAVISSNESSNAIILTDTQANVRRMVEIIGALDTSISNIAAVKVFMLGYADAEETATLVSNIFETSESEGSPTFMPRGGFPFGPGGGPQADAQSSGDSAARKALSRVVAVAETRTNAVVVSAPEDLMPTITNLIQEVDTLSDADTEVRVFPMEYAKAEEMAELVTNIFNGDSDERQGNMWFGGPMRGMMPGMPGGPPGMGGSSSSTSSTSSTSTGTVTASYDERTNAVVVNAPAQLMIQIEAMLEELDQNQARTKKVFVYTLKNADAESVAAIVEGMFQENSSTGSTTSSQNTGTSSQNTRNTGQTSQTGQTGGGQSSF